MTELTEPYPQGAPCWVDMMSTDHRVTAEFYAGLLGWEFEVGGAESGHYAMALVRGKPVAGVARMPPDARFPVVWTSYLATDDLDESLARVAAHGGQELVPVFDTGGPGRGAVAVDPTGASFGLWEAGTHIGAYLVREPGALWWNELATRDLAGASAFYRDVFGLEPQPEPGMRYSRLALGGHPVAGVFGMDAEIPPEIPPHWMTYFAVPDAEAAAARAAELGGVVVHEVVRSPFGWFTTLGDPLGATFRVIQPPPSSRG
ncbi:putative enzyme related to lactoylglutathione lyase [Saccharothrix coeruleofusca]|uniref:VOC family protein n=1 Tax=Saccharothrix coeruleofusca TaxID=33919 RepID=UPI001AE38B25|nr:VOC family protein [Saccharothrix coeruleofusca]MBP2334228.1 putative enzyme related to lactoylglutathione lyase [Saccharothrix coeruleofusca]